MLNISEASALFAKGDWSTAVMVAMGIMSPLQAKVEAEVTEEDDPFVQQAQEWSEHCASVRQDVASGATREYDRSHWTHNNW